MRLIGLFFFFRMKFPPTVLQPLQQREELRDYLNVFQARHDMFLLFVGLWGFALNLGQPFYSVYVLRELPLSISHLTMFTTLQSLGGLLTLPSWGVLGDRFGSKPVMLACSFLWVIVALPSWLLAGPERHLHLYLHDFLVGAATAGFQLSQFNLMVKMIPARTTAPYISVFLAGISIMTAAGPLVGGQLLTRLPHDIGILLGEPVLRFHVVFVGSMGLCLLATHILQHMQEPAERPLSELVRVMRKMRELNPVLGLAAVAESVFTPRRLTLFSAERSLRRLRRQTGDLAEVGEELADAGIDALRRRWTQGPDDRPPRASSACSEPFSAGPRGPRRPELSDGPEGAARSPKPRPLWRNALVARPVRASSRPGRR